MENLYVVSASASVLTLLHCFHYSVEMSNNCCFQLCANGLSIPGSDRDGWGCGWMTLLFALQGEVHLSH